MTSNDHDQTTLHMVSWPVFIAVLPSNTVHSLADSCRYLFQPLTCGPDVKSNLRDDKDKATHWGSGINVAPKVPAAVFQSAPHPDFELLASVLNPNHNRGWWVRSVAELLKLRGSSNSRWVLLTNKCHWLSPAVATSVQCSKTVIGSRSHQILQVEGTACRVPNCVWVLYFYNEHRRWNEALRCEMSFGRKRMCVCDYVYASVGTSPLPNRWEAMPTKQRAEFNHFTRQASKPLYQLKLTHIAGSNETYLYVPNGIACWCSHICMKQKPRVFSLQLDTGYFKLWMSMYPQGFWYRCIQACPLAESWNTNA